MYPQRELTALAAGRAALRRRIALRCTLCAQMAARAVRSLTGARDLSPRD